MKTIHKFPVECSDTIRVILPSGALPLHFDMQRQALCLWAMIDTDVLETEVYSFRMAGTGSDLGPDTLRYLNTIMAHGGSLVFHFFEIIS